MKTVRIPADIDQDDKLLAGLSARQLVLAAVPTVAWWLVYLVTRTLVPFIVFAPFAVVVSGATGTLIVTKHNGMSLDRFAMAAWRHHRAPKRYVTITDDVVTLPASITALNLPVLGVGADGTVDLGTQGAAVICRAHAVNLGLQSEMEQEALTAAFGRFCNGMSDSLQILIRTDRVELGMVAAGLDVVAPGLASVGLERSACDYGAFLRQLGTQRDVMARSVFVVFREATVSGTLLRRASDAALALHGAGVTLEVLDGAAATAVIQRATSPDGARIPFLNDIVSGGTR